MVNRELAFWLACIPSRVALAHYVSTTRNTVLRQLAWLPGLAWGLGLVNKQVGFAGGPAWWAPMRVWHGALWCAYAYTGDGSWMWGDVLLGVYDKLIS